MKMAGGKDSVIRNTLFMGIKNTNQISCAVNFSFD
jgi:hypothetical protein